VRGFFIKGIEMTVNELIEALRGVLAIGGGEFQVEVRDNIGDFSDLDAVRVDEEIKKVRLDW
jgi:hypothetical protein